MRHPIIVALCAACLALAVGCTTSASNPEPGQDQSTPPVAASPTPPPAANTPAVTSSPPTATTGPTQAAPTNSVPATQPPASNTPLPTTTPVGPAITQQGAPIALQPVAEDLDRPLYITHAGDGSGRLFVVEKAGTIVVLRNGAPQPTPFLDITDRVRSAESERGLLSVAFHPRFAENGRLFVYYTDRNGDAVVSRFQAEGDAADPNSEMVLLTIPQPYPNHNGGLVQFGPDGYLYIGTGDGGSGGDPQGNGQRLDTLLGKILRIDVDGGEPYAVPADNPWASGSGARPEIWAYGLRNPWRFSFDRATGDLYVADVGQNAYEEVNVVPAGSQGGENYGWNVMEGAHCFRAQSCDQSPYVLPVAEYGRDGGCSITGGYVYRGSAIPSIVGAYFFGDYCSGRIWMLRNVSGNWEMTDVLRTDLNISSFGEDEAGELYITDLRGGVYRVAAP